MLAELIYNPRAGQVTVRHELETVIGFLNGFGWHVSYQETKAPKEATGLARNAALKGVDVVIAAGGDGTVGEVANGLVHSGTALGVLPVGTTNSWAIQMGIPALHPLSPSTNVAKLVTNLETRMSHPIPANYYRKIILDAARVLVEGRAIPVDMGEVSGRNFLMWSGIGLDATVLQSIPPAQKKMLGSWAYFVTAMGTLSQYPSSDIRLTLDEKTFNVITPLIIVSNIQLYGGMMAIGANARVNDGKLDVCIFKGDGLFSFAQHGMKILSHQHLNNPKVEYYQCREITVESAKPLPVHIDGEPFTETPVKIKTVPSCLRVIVSKHAPGALFSAPAGKEPGIERTVA
jgi:diacylglycerol kinase (ATP)